MGNLASDMDNPAFQGSIPNPDELLHVRFYYDEPVDKFASEKASDEAGRWTPVKLAKTIFIEIQRPGDQLSIIQRPMYETDKYRFPKHWIRFQIQEGMSEQTIPGWSVDEWSELSEGQRRELKYLRFQVVEQIAGASDSQVQQMGMNGPGLREKAKQALRARMGAETRDAIKEKDLEIADLKAKDAEKGERLAKLEALFSTMTPQVEAPSATPPIPEAPAESPKKRGWPKGKPRKPKEVSA